MWNFEHLFDLLNVMDKHRKGCNEAYAVKVRKINSVGRLTQEDKLLFSELQK